MKENENPVLIKASYIGDEEVPGWVVENTKLVEITCIQPNPSIRE